MNNSQNFEKAYADFKQVRSNEREKIISMMEKIQNWKVSDRKNSGKGSKAYGRKRRAVPMPSYDLGNWMYIEFEIPELKKKFCLDLQSFDTDHSTANSHFLDQRLSLYVCLDEKSTKFLTIPSYMDKKELKAFDLPLCDEEIKMLLNFIDRYTAWYCKMPTFSKDDLLK